MNELRTFSRSSETWSRRLFWATVVVVVFTVVLIALAVEQAYLIWVQIDRAR